MKYRTSPFSHATQDGENIFHFLFEPIIMIDRVKYLVRVMEGLEKNSFFYMEKTHSGWKIINAPQVAEPFLRMESALAKVIEKNSDN